MALAKPPFPRLRRSHPLSAGLIGFWPMAEGSGAVLTADVVNGQDALPDVAPAWVGGAYGSGLSFGGSSSCRLPYSVTDALGGLPEITMACVFNGANARSCLRLQTVATDYAILVWTGDSVTFRSIFSQDGATTGPAWPSTINDGNPHVLVATRRTSGTIDLYCDGVRVNSVAANSSSNPTFSHTFQSTIGRYGGSSTEFTNGTISAALVSSRYWTADDVAVFTADPFVLVRPRRFSIKAAAVGGFTAQFRKSLSPLGGRIGSRQGWAA